MKVKSIGKNKRTTRIEKIFATKGDLKGEIDILWNPVDRAASYVIQISSSKGITKWKQVDIVTKSHCTITGLRSNQSYMIRAASVCNSGQNEWSDIITEEAA